jgi:hypothetical protein
VVRVDLNTPCSTKTRVRKYMQYTVQLLLSIAQAGFALIPALPRWGGVFPVGLLSVVAIYPMAGKTKQRPIVKNHKGKTTGEMGRGIVHHATIPLPSHWKSAKNLLKVHKRENFFWLRF